MKGFSAALRQGITRSSPSSRVARRKFANAATGSSKNMMPNRDTIRSKVAGSNAQVCALSQMKVAGVRSRSERARAAATSGSEMSTPTQVGTSRTEGAASAAPSSVPFNRRAIAIVVAPAPHPTSRTARRGFLDASATSRSSNGL
jgi:hypothetical protein